MSQIKIQDLTFGYDGSYHTIFEKVSFQLDSSWKLGLIGRNGKGKTTLLNLLMGKYEYQGSIHTNVIFDYFPYETPDETRLTIRIVEEIDTNFEMWKVCRELSLLQVSDEVLYRSFETLSNGERTKVMLAVLFSRENHFLLIDEPTNHLDMDTREVVRDYLKSKKGFILVSHDRYFLDGCIDHVLAINKADTQVQQGNFSSWWENKERIEAFEMAENEKLKREIVRLSQAAKEKERCSDAVEKTKYGTKNSGLRPDRGFIGHKSAKMMARAKNIESRAYAAIKDKKKLLKNVEKVDSLKLFPLTYHKTRLLTVEDLGISYEDRAVFQDMNFSVNAGERVILQGRNGCGKSSILKLLTGEKISFTGKLEVGSGLVISYVQQDASFLMGSLADFIHQNKLDESLFKAILKKLDVSRTQFDKPMQEYSAGQKKKILIARSLTQQAHLYLWDEPLNYIDIFSRMQIEELILKYSPTLLMVEHDRDFCEKVATGSVYF